MLADISGLSSNPCHMHIFTMVWGKHHIDLFRRACFRSLCWPKNLAAIKANAKSWIVYTKPEHFKEIEAIFDSSTLGDDFVFHLIPIEESMRVSGCGYVKTSQCDAGVILLNGLRDEIARCVQSNQRMLFAPPDTIFGDGSVENLIALGASPYSCVSVAHPRVLPSIIDDLEYMCATRGEVKNANLVTLAFKHAHDSWRYAEIGHAKNNAYIGGIAWKRLSDGLYSVTHRLPTAYFVHFTPSDYDFFWGQSSFGGWDHRWPAENLIRFERQRYIGSSDAAFIVEITDHDKNVPPDFTQKPEGLAEDAYWNTHYHNLINRQTSVILRGE